MTVKVPKNVADSIEFFKEAGYSNESILKVFISGDVDHCIDGDCLVNYAKNNFTDAFNAVVNGYEVEREPNEVIKWQFDMWKRDMNLFPEREQTYFWRREGMKDTLDILGLKIEGVNA